RYTGLARSGVCIREHWCGPDKPTGSRPLYESSSGHPYWSASTEIPPRAAGGLMGNNSSISFYIRSVEPGTRESCPRLWFFVDAANHVAHRPHIRPIRVFRFEFSRKYFAGLVD